MGETKPMNANIFVRRMSLSDKVSDEILRLKVLSVGGQKLKYLYGEGEDRMISVDDMVYAKKSDLQNFNEHLTVNRIDLIAYD